jgi:hypothetical protein
MLGRARAEEVARVRGDLEATHRKLQRLQEARAVSGARIVVPPPERQPSFLRATASSASKAVQAAPRGGRAAGHGAQRLGVGWAAPACTTAFGGCCKG